MRRRALLLGLLPIAAQAAEPTRPDAAAERQRQLERWWEHQRQREAADRFWNGPAEARRNLTRDQVERWERQRERRNGLPHYPF
ncbi:MAG TPA: hypothetical protein VE684_09635 [Crenalkalicoccus sp.]|jgi:hypothetical protein|nr:hypothetical protein [Crenalkalicoccus sp.]